MLVVARCACWTRNQHERVIDWFCGLGNFTLPIATMAGEVLGIEGSETLVARSRDNLRGATRPGAAQPLAPTTFVARNLFEMTPELLMADGAADKWLVDPPREGAFALAKTLADLHQNPEQRGAWTPPRRIVYVSCNPATLARDAGLLVHQGGLPLHGGGGGQHVPAHGACGKHGGVRADRRLSAAGLLRSAGCAALVQDLWALSAWPVGSPPCSAAGSAAGGSLLDGMPKISFSRM